MQALDKLIMFQMPVSDMAKSKEFYEGTMGFKVTKDFGKGDKHWVTLEFPRGGTSLTLTTNHETIKPGTTTLYISASDIEAAHKQLQTKGTSEIADDLYGPGSGVKWFSIDDPDGNHWNIVHAK